MLGFGDSWYSFSFFKNPRVIEEGLKAAGAVRIGDFGQADAADPIAQEDCVENWMDGIWKDLARALVLREPLSDEVLTRMQTETLERLPEERALPRPILGSLLLSASSEPSATVQPLLLSPTKALVERVP